MTKLSANQESLVRLMVENEEQARWGFQLLSGRTGSEKLFDALAKEGFFDPDRNPPPAPARLAGHVRIPYWSALDYLKSVAKLAGDANDEALANKVLTVVRSVSRFREKDGTVRDNYHTYRAFAEILGLVPTSTVLPEDLDLIPDWLSGQFDSAIVGDTLGKDVLPRFLKSDSVDDWDKACMVLKHCTAIRWERDKFLGGDYEKPVTILEGYWLDKALDDNSEQLGVRVAKRAADILIARTREVFDQNRRKSPSYWIRQTIEDHKQNHESHDPEHIFVRGTRDVLLNWRDPDQLRTHIEQLICDEMEIVRRIGIYILNERWEFLRDLYPSIIGPRLFDAGHLHETYQLLKNHFSSFADIEKERTITAIRDLPTPKTDEESAKRLKYIQRNWLTAVRGQGYEPAEKWFAELLADQTLGALSEHPDFHAYSESWVGPGPTPYGPNELVAFAVDGSLIDKLNAFRQPNTWRGPTTRSLVDSLEESVKLAPHVFIAYLSKFLSAKRPYQYGVIRGFDQIWNAGKDKPVEFDWNKAWPEIISFFEQLIGNPKFWSEEVIEDHDLTPNRDWIPSLISRFLKSGTQTDERAYPADLLSRGWALIQVLLENSKSEDNVPDSDALTIAINSPRGVAIEALFNHTLRVCRVSDREKGDHRTVWAEMKPTFEREIAACKSGNYEFSALAGVYFATLIYIDRDWTRSIVTEVFPKDFRDNFIAALDGLAHAHATRDVYDFLVTTGTIDLALRTEVKDHYTREVLIERIAVAYLWGIENLDSPRFSFLFKSEKVEDLQIASRFFWRIRDQDISDEHVSRIQLFWDRCLSGDEPAISQSRALLSSLSLLSLYLETVGEKEQAWLMAVAPHVEEGYNANHFIEQLNRLAEANPVQIHAVLGRLLETFIPFHDYHDQLKFLLRKLSDKGQDVIPFFERLRDVPGMLGLFKELKPDFA